MRRRAPAWVLASAFLLAGCSGAPGGPAADLGGAPDGSPGWVQDAPRLELVGCDATFLEYTTPASRLEPFLPSGYEALAKLGPLAGVGLTVLDCRSAVLDGTRVVRGLQWVQVSVAARAPPDAAAPEAPDRYLFELLVSAPEVAALLESEGIDAGLGSIEVQRQGLANALRVLQGGRVLYEYQGSAGLGESSLGYQDALRYHQAEGEHRVWFDAGALGTLTTHQVQETGRLSAHGGFIGRTLLEPWGSTVSLRGAADLSFLLDFASGTGPASPHPAPSSATSVPIASASR